MRAGLFPGEGGQVRGGRPVEGTLRKVKFYSDLGMTASDGAQCFMYEAYQADFKKRRERSRDRLLPWLKKQS